MLGDCGLRNAELRALSARSLRRPRANSRQHSLFMLGKGDVEREVPLPAETHAALGRWLALHPAAGPGGKLADRELLFTRLVDGAPSTLRSDHALSDIALAKIIARHAKAAEIPTRLAHPHGLRCCYATTTLASGGIAVHRIATRLGHASIETTCRYFAETEHDAASVGEVLDRRPRSLAGASPRGPPTVGA